MTTTNIIDTCDLKVATQQYESLRANVLGEINQAPKLTLFLRDGMCAWLHALGGHGNDCRALRRQPSAVIATGDADMSGAGLASILTDAILNASVTGGHFGGTR